MKTSRFLIISFIIAAFVIGIGTGYLVAPEYSMAGYEAKQMVDLGKADKYVDLRYLNAMIAHHRGAMILAEQAKEKSTRSEIKELAEDILAGEPKAITELYQWKKEWYRDNRKVRDETVPNLGGYDENFDLRFLNALIAHHEEGILMAKEIRLKSSRAEVLNNADAVIEFLTGGLTMLNEWRTDWYAK
ncbi:MAG: DUF305 domain-containing protein [Candidatus Humimicrobiaceae bacterium]